MQLADIIHHQITIQLDTLKTDEELVTAIQTQLGKLGLYPEKAVDGDYGPMTEQGIGEFCQRFSLLSQQQNQYNRAFAEKLLTPPAVPSPNLSVKREQLYTEYLNAANGGTADTPKLFYQGVQTSPRKGEIENYPSYLMRKPDGKKLVAFPAVTTGFQPYPRVGEVPPIDEQGLDFLHPDIQEACLCVGSFAEGTFYGKWLGRNALQNDEFWSATKIIPLLYLITQGNRSAYHLDLDRCNIRGWDGFGDYRNLAVHDLARDLISYKGNITTSNSLGAMFKRFAPQTTLERWLQSLTGNDQSIFRGRYGEPPFIEFPELFDRTTGQVLLYPDAQPPQWESNTLSAYDLTRMISLLGWHYYLSPSARIPGGQWHSLESAVRALGHDPARLTDLALAKLNLEEHLDPIVVLSKLGNGVTGIRHRTEAVYVALVHLLDRRPQQSYQPPRLITFALALRGARKLSPRNVNQEAVELDARMATEVTEVVRRAVQGELIVGS